MRKNSQLKVERMNKISLMLLSMIPGVVLANENLIIAKVRVTSRTPENVVNTIPLIQKITTGLGAPRIRFTLDSEQNALEVSIHKGDNADVLVGTLRSILGKDVLIEKMTPESMAFGTQDSIMKP